ncbi:MAG: hypothetical protein PVG03_04970 [Desulfarculaceae bacterium]|jgi:hypothetical protein
MVALVGGLAALLLGIIGLITWWDEFVWLLKGIIPLFLLFGGALATYLGSEEVKDKRRAEMESAREPFSSDTEDVAKYKQEVADLKAKLESMETKPSSEEAPPPPPEKD